MTLSEFRQSLHTAQHNFADTLAFIHNNYLYTPCMFSNGNITNSAGQNEGSCKLLGFAKLEGLSLEETLLAFGEHYRAVLATPNGSDHANIRTLLNSGLDGVHFSQPPIKPLHTA